MSSVATSPAHHQEPLEVSAARGLEGLLARPHLLATLDGLSEQRVTIVCAPAGSGKTSLLRTWAAQQSRRVAFVTVERERADGQLLCHSLLDALGQPSSAGPLEEEGAEGPFDPELLLERVTAGLQDNGPVVLIVDDLHELASEEALAQLERVIAHLPASARAILSSRRDPRLRLHRLRLEGEVAEIRAQELRFNELETRELMRASGVVLSDEGVDAICRRTEGWAAGLRLAALTLVSHPDPERFVEEFSGGDRAVSEYLLAEMLERQPSDVQEMLLRTSIVPRMNGELADRLAGRRDSEQILLELEDANAFVVSLDRQRSWFRYHQLLADFLRLELRRTLADEVPDLHRRAAAWFADQGDALEAAGHLLAAGDWPEAARLLADHVFDLTLDGRQTALAAVLRSFPPGASANDPDLALVHAASEISQGRLQEAAAHLALAEAYLKGAVAGRRQAAESALVASRLALARRSGRFAEVNGLAESVLSGGPRNSADVAVDAELQGVALMNRGIAELWSGTPEQAERDLSEAAELAETIERPYLQLASRAHLGFAATPRSLSVARERARETIALAERHGWEEDPLLAIALATLAGTSALMGELEDGEAWLKRARSAVERKLDPAAGAVLHLVAGLLHAGRGDHQASLEDLELAEERIALLEGEHLLAPQVSGWIVCAQARLGRTDRARTLLAGLPPARAETGPVHVARALVELAEGEAAAALAALQAVLDGTSRAAYPVTVVEAWLIEGLAHLELGARGDAKAAAEAALSAAEPDGVLLPFMTVHSPALLEMLPPQETSHRALLIEVGELLDGTRAPASRRDRTITLDPLSPSELRVLRYLPTNLTRPEIARELYVSVNTVNTHIRNIYAKLGARGRSAAVEQARGLKLLAARSR